MASSSVAFDPAPTANTATHHSTGPRTPEGKARSSQNATKHGLSAKTLTVLPHEQAEFENYQNELIGQIKPTEGLQADLFRQLVHAGWSLVRLEYFELQILEQGNPFDSPEAQAKLDRLERYRAGHRRAYSRILAEIRKLQTDDMLWLVTHDLVQKQKAEQFPIADPAARSLNTQLTNATEFLNHKDNWNRADAEETKAFLEFDKTNSRGHA